MVDSSASINVPERRKSKAEKNNKTENLKVMNEKAIRIEN